MTTKKGTTVITSQPFTYVLSSKYKDDHCDHCLKCDKLLKCSACKYVYYCDRLCQKESWDMHKLECKNLIKVLPRIVPDAARLMARIIAKLKNGGDEEKDYYSDNNFRKFKDLMSHYSDIKQDKKRMEHFVSLVAVLQDFMGKDNLPNSAELLGIYGRMCINSFNVLDLDMNTIGVGIYLGPSVLDHSCKPNAVAVFEGTTIILRTLEDIPNFDLSKLRISYIDVLNSTKSRRDELQSTYYFHCECKKCKSEELFVEAGLCSSCSAPIIIDNEICNICKKKIPSELKNKYKDAMELTTEYLNSVTSCAYLDVSKKCLEKQKNVFHPFNCQHMRTLESAFDAAVDMGYWEDAESYGGQLIPGYVHHYGEIHPVVGLHLLMIGKIQLQLNKAKESLESIEKAQAILKVTHGEKHSLLIQNLKPLLNQAKVESQSLRN